MNGKEIDRRRPTADRPLRCADLRRSANGGRRSTVFAAGFMLLLFAGSAFAQLPPGKWWRRPDLVTRLQLTEEQQDKLDGVFRASANELIDLRGEVEKANVALRGDLDQVQLNRQNILKDAARLNEARGRLFSRELAMMIDMRAVLNDAQWNHLREELDRAGEGQRQQQPRRNGGGGPRAPRP